MASITSLSNSNYNTSSIYGTRNVLSGLASGMDTETMIENAVSGIKLKIQNLVKKRTKVEWQQEAYRSIIDKAVNLNQKYTSYASKTNLMSNSFFANAVNTTTLGTYKDKVSASGKTSSDIRLNAVKQMATAASYTVSGLGGITPGEIAGESVNLDGKTTISGISGMMTLQYGGTNGTEFDLDFGELENISQVKVYNADGTEKTDASDAEKLAQAINNKLAEQKYTSTRYGFSEVMTADKAIKAEVKDGRITFKDQLGNGNAVKVSYTSGKLKDAISLDEDDKTGFNLTYDAKLTEEVDTKEYLSGKTLNFTYNGKTKKVTLGDYGEDATAADVVNDIQTQLDEAFGKNKVLVKNDASEDGKLALNVTAREQGATLSISGEGTAALGLGEDGKANYVDSGKKLKDLLGSKTSDIFTAANRMGAVGAVNEDKGTDSAGNKVAKAEDGKFYRTDNDGKFLYDFKVNGASIAVTEDTTLESLMNSINSNAEAGVKVSYSKMTNEFKFTATETGENSRVAFDGLAKDLFGDPSAKVELNSKTKLSEVLGTGLSGKFEIKLGDETLSVGRDDNSDIGGTVYWLNQKIQGNDALKDKVTASFDYDRNTFVFKDQDGKELDFQYGEGMAQNFADAVKSRYVNGQDAIMDVTVNGKRFEDLTRSSNTFEIDGLNITAKGEFTTGVDKDGKPEEAVTFQTSTDSDKIVEAIKGFVDDYNEMVTELKNAYSTMPATKNGRANGTRYEPLTAEEEDKYSESELKSYNEKAKQGILFGDSTLSSMYGKLLNAIQPGGTDGQILREIGIGTSYSGGLTTLSLDEDRLRAALESDPDKVKNAFTKTKEGGSATDGLMKTMQNTLDAYVKTTGEPKGVLITRAGSIKAPTSLNSNSLKSQMDSIDSQIDRWTDKMADQIDRYTTKFSKLEQLIAEMNSQSSALMGLMGGSSGY